VKYPLDTDHISIWQRGSGPEYLALRANLQKQAPGDVALCVVSFHEQVLGCDTYIVRARTTADVLRGYAMLSRMLADYAAVAVLGFDTAAGAAYDSMQAQRIRIGAMDLRLASIALSRGLVLLSRNLGDFGRVPGLAIENWTV
jgi:tRNA(fMet)-specific endonuclease VapC